MSFRYVIRLRDGRTLGAEEVELLEGWLRARVPRFEVVEHPVERVGVQQLAGYDHRTFPAGHVLEVIENGDPA